MGFGFNRSEENQKAFELTPEGTFDARLIWVIDCGTNDDTYKGVTYPKHSVYLAWELIGTKMNDGRPFVVGKFFTISNSKKGYTPFISNSSGTFKLIKELTREKDEKKLSKLSNLGKLLESSAAARITIVHEERDNGYTKAVVDSIRHHPKPENIPSPENQPLGYEIGGPFYDSIPRFLKNKIETSYEWNRKPIHTETSEQPKVTINTHVDDVVFEDDIPF